MKGVYDMNKRQYKKYAKKNYCKSYYNVRQKHMLRKATEICKNLGKEMWCLCITDSRRMNLKHPIKIELVLRDILYEDEILQYIEKQKKRPIKCTLKYNGVDLND